MDSQMNFMLLVGLTPKHAIPFDAPGAIRPEQELFCASDFKHTAQKLESSFIVQPAWQIWFPGISFYFVFLV